VPFDGADAEEWFGADLGVGAPVPGQPRDVLFLRCELVGVGIWTPLADLLTRSLQLRARPFCETFGAHGWEQLVCGAELLACVDAPAFAA
jgi:hypothetical protein